MSKLAPVMGALGSLPFVCAYGKVLTFSDLKRDTSARWARHDVIGKKPVLEWVGEDLTKISLTIRFDASMGVRPDFGLEHLQRMISNREIKTLIIGGEYFGRFVIESISEDRKFWTGAGVCTVAEATVNLIEMAGERTHSWSKLASQISTRFRGLFG